MLHFAEEQMQPEEHEGNQAKPIFPSLTYREKQTTCTVSFSNICLPKGNTAEELF